MTEERLWLGLTTIEAAWRDGQFGYAPCDSGSGRHGGDNLLAPGETPQSGGEAASPNPPQDNPPGDKQMSGTPDIDDTAICPACDGSGFGSGDSYCGFCGGCGGVPIAEAQRFASQARGEAA